MVLRQDEMGMRLQLSSGAVNRLAMLCGILERTPAEVVTELLTAAFPDEIEAKWESQGKSETRGLRPHVVWEKD